MLVNNRIDKQEYVTLLLPREQAQSTYLLPYPLLYHYIENKDWSPQEKDVVLLHNQLAEIRQVTDPVPTYLHFLLVSYCYSTSSDC